MEERSDRRNHSGYLLQPAGEEGVSSGYGGLGGYDGSVGTMVRLETLGMLEVEDEVRERAEELR